MCGITGWIGPVGPEDRIRSMNAAVAHRGPDGEGFAVLPMEDAGVAVLGHRRLAIIDLSTGAQPMTSHDGRFTIVFNGEIYNYIEIRNELIAHGARFLTQSDTEVILEAWRYWGPRALARFRGMFAFALHDSENRQVVLARDHFGKKPLYLAERVSEGRKLLIFASEIQALLTHPAVNAELDVASLKTYLTWRYVPSPDTLFTGVRKLAPGSWMTCSSEGEIKEERYWTPPEAQEKSRPPPTDPVAEFLEIFDEAIRLRLRADVPLGAFLSGGLDSTSIVASLVHQGVSDIRTFSVGFRGDPESELPLAEATARELGTSHTPIELDPDDLTALLPMLSRHRASPIAETADLPIYRMSLEAAKQVKVVLSGEGADEMFAGYPKHWVEARFGSLAPSLLSTIGRGLQSAANLAPERFRRLGIAAKAMRQPDFENRMVAWFGAFSPAERDAIWIGPLVDARHGQMPFRAAARATPLRRVLHFDQTSWLPDNLLERMDVMTMAASIEGRAPFMDVRLAEFAARLPDDWRVRGRGGKYIQRVALAPRLPKAVIGRRKNGFRMPVTEWFRGPLVEPFRDLVTGADSRTCNYVDRVAIDRLLDAHSAGRENHDKVLWSLFALETFLREFF